MQKRKNWTAQEDSLIRKFANTKTKPKWSKILKSIKAIDPHFERTAKQIRERWTSNINPNLEHQNWTEEEEETVFRQYLQHGSEWKKIQKMLPTRSTKSIKNLFYKTLRKSLRRITKILGSKQSTSQNREIKPQVITKLIESMGEENQKKELLFSLFELSRVKNRQCKQVQFQEHDLQTYIKLIDDIMYYNQIYVTNKKLGIKALQERELYSHDQRMKKIAQFFAQGPYLSSVKQQNTDLKVKIQCDYDFTLTQSVAKLQQENVYVKCEPVIKFEESLFGPCIHAYPLACLPQNTILVPQNITPNQTNGNSLNRRVTRKSINTQKNIR